MRIADIVLQLRQILPGKTELFSDTLDVTSIEATATTATITTASRHRLSAGFPVTLSGVETRTPIEIAIQDGFLTQFTTSADHDLTENNPDTETVTLEGFPDSAWNAAHELVRVPNRRTFIVRNTLGLPALNGDEILLEPDRIDGINGLYEIASVTDRTFTIEGSFVPGTYTPVAGRVSSAPRIFGAITAERARDIYDETPRGFWLAVVPADAVVSKDRSAESDAIATRVTGEDMRLRLVDTFGVLVFAPVDRELAALSSLDICRHDLLGPIVSSLYGTRPSTGLSCDVSEFRLSFLGHRAFDYDRGVLVYEYSFQSASDLTSDDTVILSTDRAFRDVDYSQINLTTPATVSVNLDEEPLG